MILTSDSTRVAVPWKLPCPECGTPINDWHLEWYDPAEQQAIFKGEALYDCPSCGSGVNGVQADIRKHNPEDGELPILSRSMALAEKWAQRYGRDMPWLLEEEPIYEGYPWKELSPVTASLREP